jgi:hypothetical protein
LVVVGGTAWVVTALDGLPGGGLPEPVDVGEPPGLVDVGGLPGVIDGGGLPGCVDGGPEGGGGPGDTVSTFTLVVAVCVSTAS